MSWVVFGPDGMHLVEDEAEGRATQRWLDDRQEAYIEGWEAAHPERTPRWLPDGVTKEQALQQWLALLSTGLPQVEATKSLLRVLGQPPEAHCEAAERAFRRWAKKVR